jgi:hypothetical protein
MGPSPWRRSAVVPHRAALASPSRRRVVGGCPGVVDTAPCGLGGQPTSIRCRVGVKPPYLPYQLRSAALARVRRLAVLPCFPPRRRGPALEPHCLLHLAPIHRGCRVVASWPTSPTVHLSFLSSGGFQFRVQVRPRHSRSELHLFLELFPPTVPGKLVAPLEPPWSPLRGAHHLCGCGALLCR